MYFWFFSFTVLLSTATVPQIPTISKLVEVRETVGENVNQTTAVTTNDLNYQANSDLSIITNTNQP